MGLSVSNIGKCKEAECADECVGVTVLTMWVLPVMAPPTPLHAVMCAATVWREEVSRIIVEMQFVEHQTIGNIHKLSPAGARTLKYNHSYTPHSSRHSTGWIPIN